MKPDISKLGDYNGIPVYTDSFMESGDFQVCHGPKVENPNEGRMMHIGEDGKPHIELPEEDRGYVVKFIVCGYSSMDDFMKVADRLNKAIEKRNRVANKFKI